MIYESSWPEALQKAATRSRRGLSPELDKKFQRHINEMRHLTKDSQLGEFLMVYALGGEVDDALNRAMKCMRIYIGSER